MTVSEASVMAWFMASTLGCVSRAMFAKVSLMVVKAVVAVSSLSRALECFIG